MSPALNKSSVVQCFECSDVIKIHDGMTFDFYTGLSHMYISLKNTYTHTHVPPHPHPNPPPPTHTHTDALNSADDS